MKTSLPFRFPYFNSPSLTCDISSFTFVDVIGFSLNVIPFVNIISLIFRFVNYFENVARRQRNVSELQLNFIRVFLSNS